MTTNQTLARPASLSEYRERLQQTRAPIVTESIQRGQAYQPQPNDLFLTPSDKFSATWLQQIVHSLRTQGDMEFDDISQVIPWLEMAHRLGLDIHAPQRGGFQAFKSTSVGRTSPKEGATSLPSAILKMSWSLCITSSTVGIGKLASSQ